MGCAPTSAAGEGLGEGGGTRTPISTTCRGKETLNSVDRSFQKQSWPALHGRPAASRGRQSARGEALAGPGRPGVAERLCSPRGSRVA